MVFIASLPIEGRDHAEAVLAIDLQKFAQHETERPAFKGGAVERLAPDDLFDVAQFVFLHDRHIVVSSTPLAGRVTVTSGPADRLVTPRKGVAMLAERDRVK